MDNSNEGHFFVTYRALMVADDVVQLINGPQLAVDLIAQTSGRIYENTKAAPVVVFMCLGNGIEKK